MLAILIVVCVLAGLALAALIIFPCLLCWRRNHRQQPEAQGMMQGQANGDDADLLARLLRRLLPMLRFLP